VPRAIAQPGLRLVQNRRAAYEQAAASWERAFFGAEDPGPVALVEAEAARLDAAHQMMLTRFAFLPLRRRLPRLKRSTAVAWPSPSPPFRPPQARRSRSPGRC
jgi:hypothetical protein